MMSTSELHLDYLRPQGISDATWQALLDEVDAAPIYVREGCEAALTKDIHYALESDAQEYVIVEDDLPLIAAIAAKVACKHIVMTVLIAMKDGIELAHEERLDKMYGDPLAQDQEG